MAHVHVDDKTFYNILTKIDEFEFNDLGYGNHLIKINKAGTPKNTVMNAGWRHIYELNQYFDKKNSKLPEEQHIILKQDLIRKVKKDDQVPDLPTIFTINDFAIY